MHDDIVYKTKNWGKKVIDHFSKEMVGIIGIVGSHYLQKGIAYYHDMNPYLSGTVCDEFNEYKHMDYLQNKKSIQVAIVDGFWFCIPKKLFEIIKFDEKLFENFHFYDMDICMQINCILKKQVLVISDIKINHLSSALLNESFYVNMLIFNEKWNRELPIIRGIEVDTKICDLLEEKTAIYYRLLKEYFRSRNEISRILNSRAYRLGKMLLTPLNFFIKR